MDPAIDPVAPENEPLDTGEDTLIDDLDLEPENEPLDTPEGEPDGETPETPETEDWTPPTREEWEAAQAERATLTELLGENFEKILNGEEPGEAPAPIAQDELQALLTPKTFAPAPDLTNRILVDGDGEALTEFANNLIETMEHNFNIKMNQAVLRGLDYAAPILAATSKFYERNPELIGMRELVKNHMHHARASMPQANELQILRAVETRLGPVIKQAKKIAQQHAAGGKGAATNRNLAPGPAAGTAPAANRSRSAGGQKQEPTAASRLAELARFQD